MTYRNTRLRLSPDARVRRLPEWGRCLTYAADQPELYELSTTAWLILELCAAMDEAEARAAFVAILDRRLGERAPRDFDEGLERLIETGLLERAPPATGAADAPDSRVDAGAQARRMMLPRDAARRPAP